MKASRIFYNGNSITFTRYEAQFARYHLSNLKLKKKNWHIFWHNSSSNSLAVIVGLFEKFL